MVRLSPNHMKDVYVGYLIFHLSLLCLRSDGSFSFHLNIDAQEGQFYLHIFARDSKETIPYDYPVEGLVFPSRDLIYAATVVLQYDGRPLFLNADKETDFITDIIVLDDR